MWSSAQMEECAREVGGKERRDDDVFATDNVDSGFLSAGNMQVSGEIRDSGTAQEDRRTNEKRRAAPASGATTLASSVAEEPLRVIDSGVVDLSKGLNQLTLKRQPDLNSLVDLVPPEPINPILELTPVRMGPKSRNTGPQQNDLLLEQQDGAKKRAMNDNTWQQLYYAQDDDGDT